MISQRDLYSVLIVSGSEKSGTAISEFLDSRTYGPAAFAGSGSEARRILMGQDYDMTIINTPLPDEFGDELALYIAETAGGVILVVRNEVYEQVSYKVEDFGVLTIPRPVSKQLFHQSLKLLTAVRGRWKRFEKENKRLQMKVDEIRVVARAKCVLVEYLQMNETQAHRHIEKQAMDLRTTKRAVAESILKTYEP